MDRLHASHAGFDPGLCAAACTALRLEVPVAPGRPVSHPVAAGPELAFHRQALASGGLERPVCVRRPAAIHGTPG